MLKLSSFVLAICEVVFDVGKPKAQVVDRTLASACGPRKRQYSRSLLQPNLGKFGLMVAERSAMGSSQARRPNKRSELPK